MKKFGIDEYRDMYQVIRPREHPFKGLVGMYQQPLNSRIVCTLPVIRETMDPIWYEPSTTEKRVLRQLGRYEEFILEHFPERVTLHMDFYLDRNIQAWVIQVSAGFMFVEDFDEFQVLAKLTLSDIHDSSDCE